MPFALSDQTQCEIAQASRDAVKNEFSKLDIHFATGKWINSNNTLSLDTVNVIKNNNFTNDEMAEYIAASTITHLHDAWVFFGRSINALMCGDTVSARHMAYYSELRSAMSILATEGIGIFNNVHYYIDSNANCHKLTQTKGTHDMLWAVIEHWSTLDKARDLLLNCIKPQGEILENWLVNSGVTALNHLTSDIYQYIGIDLKNLAKDHNIRNRLSYRPSLIHVNNNINIIDNCQFVNKLWEKLEPGFNNLDISLLKRVIDLLDNKSIIDKDQSYIERLLNNISISQEHKNELIAYFISSNTDEIISKAMNTNSSVDNAVSDQNNHFDILSRSLILLRIATGANQKLMRDASIELDDLSFWWQDIFYNKNFFEETNTSLESSVIQDLWSDINDIAMKDTIEVISNHSENLHTLKEELSYAMVLFGETERAMLWGLSS